MTRRTSPRETRASVDSRVTALSCSRSRSRLVNDLIVRWDPRDDDASLVIRASRDLHASHAFVVARLVARRSIVALLLAGGCAVVDDSTRLDSSPRVGFGVGVARAWSPKPVLSTRDLRDNMYPPAGIAPCVLLVNTTGGVGCSTSGEAAAAVQRFTRVEDVRALDDERMLLLPALFPAVLAEYLAAPRAVGWRRHARGILVETGDCEGASCADPNAPAPSPRARARRRGSRAHPLLLGDPYPQAQLRPDADTRGDHVWNPHAIGAVSARFDDFPIALLDRDGTDLARTFADENRVRRFRETGSRPRRRRANERRGHVHRVSETRELSPRGWILRRRRRGPR